MELLIKFLPAFGVLALLFVLIKNSWVSKQEVGNEKMARIATNIADGAMSFLKAEYKILSMGHRNSQGLYYDKEHNIIYSTDHGPQGGDEINVNTSPDGEIKNYGWGI